MLARGIFKRALSLKARRRSPSGQFYSPSGRQRDTWTKRRFVSIRPFQRRFHSCLEFSFDRVPFEEHAPDSRKNSLSLCIRSLFRKEKLVGGNKTCFLYFCIFYIILTRNCNCLTIMKMTLKHY